MTNRLTEQIQFVKISVDSTYLVAVERCFSDIVTPIYGNQQEALKKIKDGKDRACEIMLANDSPRGFIVYKSSLQDEYGIHNGFELKTLLLLDPFNDSRNGWGSQLFRRVDDIAYRKKANIIYCTASSRLESSIKCAQKNGYGIAQILEKNKNQTVYLLTKELQ